MYIYVALDATTSYDLYQVLEAFHTNEYLDLVLHSNHLSLEERIPKLGCDRHAANNYAISKGKALAFAGAFFCFSVARKMILTEAQNGFNF